MTIQPVKTKSEFLLVTEEKTLLSQNRSSYLTDINVYYIHDFVSSSQGRTIPVSSDWLKAGCIIVGFSVGSTTLAHEMGHLLLNSGEHSTTYNNLMYPTNHANREELNSIQISSILNSSYVIEE